MRSGTFTLIALAITLGGCGLAAVEVGESEQALAASADQLAALELPGCDRLAQLTSATGRFRLDAHPANPALSVLTRDACPVCIDTPEQARAELDRLYTAAGLETPALISTPIDDDPVPIRGEEESTAGPEGNEGNGDDAPEGQRPSGGGNGGVSDPQLASSPVPSDDPVPIRSLAGRFRMLGSAASSSTK